MNEEFWAHQPRCEGCNYELCFLDRQFDECPMCGAPIPQEVQVP